MSNYESFNFPAFAKAAQILRSKGTIVLSAHEVHQINTDWIECIRRDLVEMLSHCSMIILLPGWEKSRGSRLELHVARAVEMPVYLFHPDAEEIQRLDYAEVDHLLDVAANT
jgi:hypothetical protein